MEVSEDPSKRVSIKNFVNIRKSVLKCAGAFAGGVTSGNGKVCR